MSGTSTAVMASVRNAKGQVAIRGPASQRRNVIDG
jgi:hypothetical protein